MEKLSDTRSISIGMIHRFIGHIMNDDFLHQKLFDFFLAYITTETAPMLNGSFLFEGTNIFILKIINSSPKCHAVLPNRPLSS